MPMAFLWQWQQLQQISHAFFKVIAYFWVCYRACMLGTKCNCLLCTTKVYMLKIYCYPIVWCYHFESSIWLQLNLTSSWKWRLMFHLHNCAFATESRCFLHIVPHLGLPYGSDWAYCQKVLKVGRQYQANKVLLEVHQKADCSGSCFHSKGQHLHSHILLGSNRCLPEMQAGSHCQPARVTWKWSYHCELQFSFELPYQAMVSQQSTLP